MFRSPALTLKARLTGGIFLLVALMAMSGVLTLKLLAQLDASQNTLVQSVQYLNATSDAATQAKSAANDERGYLLEGNRDFVASFDEAVGGAKTALASARAVFPAGS